MRREEVGGGGAVDHTPVTMLGLNHCSIPCLACLSIMGGITIPCDSGVLKHNRKGNGRQREKGNMGEENKKGKDGGWYLLT